MNSCLRRYSFLIFVYFIYSLTSIFTKNASLFGFLSPRYVWLLSGAIICLGIYAILWQQIIKKMPISDAYMFKGTTIIFTMLIAALIFGEAITITNIIGSVIIVSGIALFAKA